MLEHPTIKAAYRRALLSVRQAIEREWLMSGDTSPGPHPEADGYCRGLEWTLDYIDSVLQKGTEA